ncbi:MAG: transglycosylase SLT domain-containing protein [Acidobacteria bacterium]|nr:transglycosylase SLT domain-containing protein [Acidobacteriota bacterium]
MDYNGEMMAYPRVLALASILLLTVPTGKTAAGRSVPQEQAELSASWRQILQDEKENNWRSVLARLEALEKSYPESYRLRRADFLKAAALQRLGRPDESEVALAKLLTDDSTLRPLVLWQLFELSREAGREPRALDWLERYVSTSSALVDRESADWERAQLLQGKDPEQAVRLYRSLAGRRNRFSRAAKLRWSNLETDAAVQHALRQQLISERQSDEAAYQAAGKLAEHLEALPEPEVAALADVFLINRDLSLLRRTAQHFTHRFPASRQISFFSFLLGRAWMLDGSYEKAVDQFNRTYQRFPANRWGVQSRYFAGHVYLRLEKYSEAAATYRSVIENHPESEWLGGAYSNQTEALRWSGRRREALEVARQGAERLRTADAAALYYLAGKITMVETPSGAADFFQQALRRGERWGLPPSLGKAELYYWIGRCRERLNDWKAAADSYLQSAREDTNYFGFLSRDALRNLYATQSLVRSWSDSFLSLAGEAKSQGRKTEYREALRSRYYGVPEPEARVARMELLADLAQDPEWIRFEGLRLWPADKFDDDALHDLAGSEQKRAAAILTGLGFFQKAAELLAAAKDFDSALQQAWTAANYFGFADRWGKALEEVRKLSAGLPFDTPELMPARLFPFFLPLPISTQGRDPGSAVEPELLAALILRESRFQPDVKSPAGARGLMQLLLSTAQQTAREIGLSPPSPEDLYDPGLSMKLGTAYLDKLFRQLKHPEMAVAAYNGGSDNVIRWARKSPTEEPAMFVADIGFAETKSYVMRVLGNYRLYKILYGSRP